MVIGVVEFSIGGTKLERLLPKNQHTQKKSLNFDNWCKGSFTNYVDKILAFFDHLSPCVDIFYGINVDKMWTFLDHSLPRLVNVVIIHVDYNLKT